MDYGTLISRRSVGVSAWNLLLRLVSLLGQYHLNYFNSLAYPSMQNAKHAYYYSAMVTKMIPCNYKVK